jgi:hypothetical protein
MTKKEELDLFLLRCDELIDSKYIIANIKIINLLKSIANSETMLAIFKSCLQGFDYEDAKSKYFVINEYLGGAKGEFVQPEDSKNLLALVFSVLMDIDSGKIELTTFLNNFFYENGSYYESYNSFIKGMIVPFKFTLKALMSGIIGGTVADPKEELDKKQDEPILDETECEEFKKIRIALKDDKDHMKTKKLLPEKLRDGILIVDTFFSALDSNDKDAIYYAYTAYKYTIKSLLSFKNNQQIIEELLIKAGIIVK